MSSKFVTSTAVMREPLSASFRQQLLRSSLSSSSKALFELPIEQWGHAERTAFDAYRPTLQRSAALVDLPPVDTSHPVLRHISLYRGPVTELALDAVVNAANEGCLGGGGVDGAIHRAAGPLLQRECATHNGCPTGQCVVTKGYNLPARYVIHTVGPIGEDAALLRSCYRQVFYCCRSNGFRSVGLCGISTGAYGYPLAAATAIAVQEAAGFLEEHPNAVERICFACFLPEEADAVSKELRRCRETSSAKDAPHGQPSSNM